MTSEAVALRRGLPRVPGGEPWPPAGTAPHGAGAAQETASPVVFADPEGSATLEIPTSQASSGAAAAGRVLRRGLPRVPGGEPWPQASAAPAGVAATAPPSVPGLAVSAAEPAPEAQTVRAAEHSATDTTASSAPAPAAASSAAGSPAAGSPAAAGRVAAGSGRALRRGLPRVAGGEPWPPAGNAPEAAPSGVAPAQAAAQERAADPARPSEQLGAGGGQPARVPRAAAAAQQAPAQAAVQSAAPSAAAQQAPAPKPVQEAPAPKPAKEAPVPKPAERAAQAEPREPSRAAALTRRAGRAALWGLAVVAAAGIAVLAARGLTTLPGVPEFMRRYPGEYAPAVQPDEGFPAWARWSHFLNFFFMVLIVRTGLLVRHQQKPPAFFTPKRGGKKVSIYLWLHTSIDLLWLANGIAFVVLLFVSGHWARIVPTSWEVFPNALSAALQYATLEWPVENGWVNYNALQQLMYFAVVFIAAPLAAITGVRMSSWWPEKATGLSRAFPAPVARAVHYPVMLFFVLFVVVHVFLVLSTGALRNLNHMFAGTDRVSWAGFAWFAGGLLVTAAVTWAARPLVLAPIAGAFGRVSER